MLIKIPITQTSNENRSNSGKKSDGCKLVREIIFDEMNMIGPLINVQATILLAIRSTSVSYLLAITNAPGARKYYEYELEMIIFSTLKISIPDLLCIYI